MPHDRSTSMLALTLLLASLLAPRASLVCTLGTPASPLANCTAQPGDACIGGVFAATGAQFYACGDCAHYQNQTASFSNISCCASDRCQPLAPPPPPTDCTSLLSEANCTAQTACFWCGNASIGFDLCQTTSSAVASQCWAMPLLVSVCGAIGCAPATPAYTVNNLTLAALSAFGFPSVVATVGELAARGLALDAMSRETRYLNDTYNFCQVDAELQQWCGFATGAPFAYCIIAEAWPQSDTWGWIQNTSFTGTGSLTPIRPAFCACPVAGRAYYLPSGATDDDKHYGPHCPIEQTLLAFYVLLILLSAGVLCGVLADLAIMLHGVYRRGGRVSALESRTLAPRLVMVAYELVVIPDQVLFAIPAGTANTTLANAKAVLCFLGVILLLFSFSASVFTYVQILMDSKVLGGRRSALALSVFRWFFFLWHGLCLVAALACTIAFAVFLKQLQDLLPASLAAFAALATLDTQLAQAIMLMLLLTQATMMIFTLAMLVGVTRGLSRVSGNVRGLRDLIKRATGLWLAWAGGVPNLLLLAAITPLVSWLLTGEIPSWWPSHYQTNIAYLWMIWGYFVSSQLWLCCNAYAMRTRTKSGWFEHLFSHLIDKRTAMETGASDGSSASGQSSQLSVSDSVANDTAV